MQAIGQSARKNTMIFCSQVLPYRIFSERCKFSVCKLRCINGMKHWLLMCFFAVSALVVKMLNWPVLNGHAVRQWTLFQMFLHQDSVLWRSTCQSHLQPFLEYNNPPDYSIRTQKDFDLNNVLTRKSWRKWMNSTTPG